MNTTNVVGEEINFPPLINAEGSLTSMEKALLGTLILLTKANIILELGVFKGVTTRFICELVKMNSLASKVYAFDIPSVVKELEKNPELMAYKNEGILVFVPGYLPNSLKKWIDEHKKPIDFVLDDALHDYKSVYGELSLVWPHMEVGGYVFCHDFSHKYPGVRRAVNKFSRKRDVRMMPLVSFNIHQNQPHPKNTGSVLVGITKIGPLLKTSFKEVIQIRIEMMRHFLAHTMLWKIVRSRIKENHINE